MIIESHAHYTHNKFEQSFRCLFYKNGVYTIEDSTRGAILEYLKQNNFAAVIEPAISVESNKIIYEFSEEYKGFVFAAYGCHPMCVGGARLRDLKTIEDYASRGCVAVGETGLDYYHTKKFTQKLRQKLWFRRQIKLAYRLNKPLILHIRDACEDGLKILYKNKEYIRGGVVHCFNYDVRAAKEFIRLGLYLGIGGELLREESRERLTEVVQKIPIEYLVAETDAPYVLPDLDIYGSDKKRKNARNTSTTIFAVIEKIAEIKKMSVSDAEKALYNNTVRLFSLESLMSK